jgi:hypothetical protein
MKIPQLEEIKGWLKFTRTGLSKSGKTEEWYVKHKDDDCGLGFIRWHAPWRQYVFDALDSAYYSKGCLRDIAEFIEELMEERKDVKRQMAVSDCAR